MQQRFVTVRVKLSYRCGLAGGMALGAWGASTAVGIGGVFIAAVACFLIAWISAWYEWKGIRERTDSS